MMPPAIPPDETLRQASLDSLQIVDTPAEERFDRISRRAQRVLNVPIVLVSPVLLA